MTFLPPGDKGYPHYLMNLARLAEVSYVFLGHSKFKPVPWFHVAKKKSYKLKTTFLTTFEANLGI